MNALPCSRCSCPPNYPPPNTLWRCGACVVEVREMVFEEVMKELERKKHLEMMMHIKMMALMEPEDALRIANEEKARQVAELEAEKTRLVAEIDAERALQQKIRMSNQAARLNEVYVRGTGMLNLDAAKESGNRCTARHCSSDSSIASHMIAGEKVSSIVSHTSTEALGPIPGCKVCSIIKKVHPALAKNVFSDEKYKRDLLGKGRSADGVCKRHVAIRKAAMTPMSRGCQKGTPISDLDQDYIKSSAEKMKGRSGWEDITLYFDSCWPVTQEEVDIVKSLYYPHLLPISSVETTLSQ